MKIRRVQSFLMSYPFAEPIKLSKQQMQRVVAGSNPNVLPNGTIAESNGKSGEPGNSFQPGK